MRTLGETKPDACIEPCRQPQLRSETDAHGPYRGGRSGLGDRWFTVGVSPNIVDASFEALLDSITYKLLKNNAPPPEMLAD